MSLLIGTDRVAELDLGTSKIRQIYLGTNLIYSSVPLRIKIGGRIFYDDGDNGATYTFYDASGNVITDTSISGLANAVSYEISGTPTKDRWYVFNNELATFAQWGHFGDYIDIPNDGIGKGKANTVRAINWTSWESNSIFQYIINCNNTFLNGCNDWFIGSKAEQNKLKQSGLVNWYDSNDIWSSVESDEYYADASLHTSESGWLAVFKNDEETCFAMRSF